MTLRHGWSGCLPIGAARSSPRSCWAQSRSGRCARLDAERPGGKPRSQVPPDVALHVEQLFEDLGLGEHEKAERRVNRLFLHLSRDQQRAALAAIIRVATTTKDHTTQLLACSLLE